MFALVLLALCLATPLIPAPVTVNLATGVADFPKLSPFTAVRAQGRGYEVEFEGAWYRLISLAAFSPEQLKAHCDAAYGSRSEKRFAEDLVEVLDGLGHKAGTAVDLVLEPLDGGARVERKDARMTEENRRLVWSARNQSAGSVPVVRGRVQRAHATAATQEFAYLAQPLQWSGWEGGKTLARTAAERDLDQLEWLIEHTYSYRDLRGVNYRAAFDAMRLGLEERNPLGSFATRTAQLLALFGDGHTRVRGLEGYRPTGYTPFLAAEAGGRVVAFLADRSGFLDPEYPYLEAIDDRSLDDWLTLASRTAAQGAPHYVRERSLRELRLLNALRVEAGLESRPTCEVTLANAKGESRRVTAVLATRKPAFGTWPRTKEARMLESGIGYLRIAAMDSEPTFIAGLERTMERFRDDTRGLVIDVRGNGGGSRDALRALLPWFLAPESGPRVVNVGAYRLKPGQAEHAHGHLSNRSLYPADAAHWNADERAAIAAAQSEFDPDWQPDPASFTDWHYMVVSPGEQHYDRPVVILLDGGCFSATDIFLGAFSGVPGVTLLGTPSGGGSGRSQSAELAESRLSVRLSTMASFRPNGRRYDGKGVEPDILHEIAPTDLLGTTDTTLEAALKRLR